MKIVDIADEIFRELGEPKTLSIPAVTYWLRSNIGELNNLIYTNYSINPKDLEIIKIEDSENIEIGEEEKAVFKKMYMVHFYSQKLRTHIITLDTDTVVSVRDGDSSVTKVNRNEIAKGISSVKNQEYHELTKLVSAYRMGKSVPRQVAGDDTVAYGSTTSSSRTSKNP